MPRERSQGKALKPLAGWMRTWRPFIGWLKSANCSRTASEFVDEVIYRLFEAEDEAVGDTLAARGWELTTIRCA